MRLSLPEPKLSAQGFPRQLVLEAESLKPSAEVLGQRRQISVVTIDPALARQRDDGLHLDGHGLGISVVDPSIISRSSPIIGEILARGEAMHDGVRSVPMLPESLAFSTLSLSRNSDLLHPTVTAVVDYDSVAKRIRSELLLPTAALVTHELTYRQAFLALSEEGGEHYRLLQSMRLFSRLLREQGTLNYFCDEPGITPNFAQRESPERLVTDCNRFFDLVATEMARRNNIPVLFTNQIVKAVGQNETMLLRDYKRNPTDLRTFRRVRGLFDKLNLHNEFSTIPRGHFFFNVAAHANFTRPLRSAAAFINISNLSAHLRGAPPPFSRSDLDELGPYLTQARDLRRGEAQRKVQVRMTRMLGEANADLSSLTSKEFNCLIREVIKQDSPAQHVITELMRRIEAGQFNEATDMILIAAGPAPGASGWEKPRAKFLEWLNARKSMAHLLFYFAKREFEYWHAGERNLRWTDQGWLTWCSVLVGDKAFSAPYKILLPSANVAAKRASLAFWRSYVEGSVLEGGTEPEKIVVQGVECRIPPEFALPKAAPTEPDLFAADKLHITCSVTGLGPPKFYKEELRTSKGAPENRTTIYGLRAIEPKVATLTHVHPGRATNLSSGFILAQIRKDLAIEFITKEAIAETRKRNWLKRVEQGGPQRLLRTKRPRRNPALKFGPMVDLKDICRANGWADPEAKSAGARQVKINAGGKELMGETQLTKNLVVADNLAAQELLKKIPTLFQQSLDLLAIAKDKENPKTPLGCLYAWVSKQTGSKPKLLFYNNGPYPVARIAFEINGEKLGVSSKSGADQRSTANQAAKLMLAKISEKFPGQLSTKLPRMPSKVIDEGVIPLTHLVRVDTQRELRLLCLEQGHSEPSYQVVLHPGKKKKGKTEYVCKVVTKDGDLIQTRVARQNPTVALLVSTAFMLQQLRPAYRGAPTFVRKLDLLAKQHGVEVSTPIYADEALEKKPDVMMKRCTLSAKYEGEELKGDSLRITQASAHDAAAALVLEGMERIRKQMLWRQRQALISRK